jgi:hypothetical protein
MRSRDRRKPEVNLLIPVDKVVSVVLLCRTWRSVYSSRVFTHFVLREFTRAMNTWDKRRIVSSARGFSCEYTSHQVSCGRAIAEAVSHWFPTACGPGSRPGLAIGICGGQNGVGVGFSPSTSVSPVKTVHSTNFSILTIIRDRYNMPGVAAVPSRPSMDSTPQYPNK